MRSLTVHDLRQRAMALADQRQGQVVRTAIGGMMSLHRSDGGQGDCDCTLCASLRPYVMAKKRLSSLKQMFNDDDAYAYENVRDAENKVIIHKGAVAAAWNE